MWCLWAPLDICIFLRGMFMVYLKVKLSFIYRKNTDISVAVSLFGSVFSDVYKPLIYVCNICLDAYCCQESKYVTYLKMYGILAEIS